MKRWPLISIVTPSYNQGQFIERTIQSVISQDYPRLQYLVMDGGSTDETVKILKKYSSVLSWVSQKDGGQTDAINQGMLQAKGDILAYLNSDDVYLPGTLKKVGRFFVSHPRVNFAYSHGKLINADDELMGFYNDSAMDYQKLWGGCGISQPTTFWRRKVYETIGPFNPSYHFTMDYEYWVRVSQQYALHYLPQEVWAAARIHEAAKTVSQSQKLFSDAIRMQKEQYGLVHHDWIFTYVDGLVHDAKNASFLSEIWYWIVVLNVSFFLQLKWNHQLPTQAMWQQYQRWFAEICRRLGARLKGHHYD